MAVALEQLISSPVISDVISRIKTPLSRFQDFYGLGIGGRFTNPIGGREFGWDIFDKTRKIATGRPFGTGPSSVSPRPVGNVMARPHRSHEKVSLLHDRLFRTRPLGGGIAEVDVRGQRYVTQQAEALAQRFRNAREFMVSRMFRGSFQLAFVGEDWIPVDTGGQFTVNYQLPADHTGAIDRDPTGGTNNIIGTATNLWNDAAAPIHDDLLELNDFSEAESGWPISHAWVGSPLWAKILNNTQVKGLAGTSNTPFSMYERTNVMSAEGIGDTGFTAILRGIPWLTWHIYDGGLEVNGTYTKFIPNNNAIFTPEPSSSWCEMLEGSEWVKENVMDPGSEKTGFSTWTTHAIDPASIELKALDICLPALYVPKAIFYATVSTGL